MLDDGVHDALQSIFDGLDGENLQTHHPCLVEFDALGTVVVADVKYGDASVRIRSYFLPHAAPDDLQAAEWAERQPSPSSGLVEVSSHVEGGNEFDETRLVFERSISAPFDTLVRSDIELFAKAWRTNGIAPDAPATRLHSWTEPVERSAQNAWLLMGDEASLPDAKELELGRIHGRVGIYDTMWTVAKNARVGDLVVAYFVAPRKSANFVARLASNPFWRDDLAPNAVEEMGDKQWWAYLTPLIEVEPILARSIAEAHDGHFNFQGRSGRFLRPEVVSRLRFVAKDRAQQPAVDQIAAQPTGLADLPEPEGMTFEQWRDIASGALTLEAHVSEYIVAPFLKRGLLLTLFGGLAREHKVANGFVDFIIQGDAIHQDWDVPMAAIEVKLAIRRSHSGRWADSPDFQQLRRYMDRLDVPGILIDANSIVFVEKGADAPYLEIERSDPTGEELSQAFYDFQRAAAGLPRQSAPRGMRRRARRPSLAQ